jgi:hypothetical protein
VTPFEVYKSYLGIKNHFTRDSYDFHKYYGKSKLSLQTFYKRKDRFFFEKISRQHKETEIIDFFVSNFASSDNPQKLWVGEIIKNGDKNYIEWNKKIQSLGYVFKNELEELLSDETFDSIFALNGNSHPKILKKFLSGKISLETLVVLNKILGFNERFDKKIIDPVWELTSFKIKKYSPFLNIDVSKFKDMLKSIVLKE